MNGLPAGNRATPGREASPQARGAGEPPAASRCGRSARPRSQPSGLVGYANGVHAVPGAELGDDAGNVIADGAGRQAELPGDLGGGCAACG